ncbi:MAG: CusA/CzcA family heavy metal efflux RND transporter [Ignavibacteriaceae bacterium]|nr:CusA/CzcA family heavy metal efflux RND transporter [Ignavibacteriaceae bacterium]
MISKLLNFALSQRLITIGFVIVSIGIGIWSWITLKKEAYPDVGDTQVTVITLFPGRAAEEVEQQITLPIERALNAVPRVIDKRSKTIFGLSVIELTFEDGVDDYFARQRVLEKLNDAVLPDGVNPSLGPLTGPVGEIFRYVIESSVDHNPMELRTLQDWVIIPRLLQVPGVADVVNFGGLVKQYHVITSPDKLLRYNLTIQNVIDAVTSNNVNTGGNIIKRGGQGFVVRGIGAIKTKEDIGNIVVTSLKGVPVLIKDLASVEEFPLPPSGILGYTIKTNDTASFDVNSSIQGLIAMRRGENPSDVVDALKERVNEINETDLPAGVHLRITYDRSVLVTNTVSTVGRTLFEGFSIVIIVLIFFIGSVRSALVVATTIPISMLFAFTMMRLTGIPENLLSLGAIDFGIIVEGAVVMVENIMRRYRDATAEEKELGIIRFTLTSAQEVGREILFSITIIIMAYLPIFSFQRVEGKLFSPMAFTLAYAIGGSMILALTAIPVFMTIIYRKYFESANPGKLEWHNPVYGWIAVYYEKAISKLKNYSVATVLAAITLVVVVVLVGYKNIGTEFLPNLDEGSINIRCFLPVGISLDEANKYMPLIRNVISKNKPVNLVITQLGRNDDGTDPYGPNRLEILVGLKEYSSWIKDESKDELLKKIKDDLEITVPGALFSFSQPILDNVTEAVTGSVADLAVLISGDDLKFMRKEADSVLTVIKKVQGASEYGIEQEADQAQLSVDINRNACARFGVNVSDIQRMIEAAIGGRTVSHLYEGSRRFDIVVRYTPEYRSSIEAVKDLQVNSASGGRIPLRELASISLLDGPTIIQRENDKRQISVRTNIQGRDQGGFVKEAQDSVDKKIHLPRGYTMDWGGQFENLSRAEQRLAVVIPVTIAIIFLVLFSMYRKIRHVLVAMSGIPLALIGGIIALMLRNYAFNVSAGVGFISLFGISIMAGVLYVSRTNTLIQDFGMKTKDAVIKAAVIQLRPNMMTMVLALLGLIPAARATGIGSDVQRPFATVIVGGLCSALFLTLLVFPSLYLVVESIGKKKLK